MATIPAVFAATLVLLAIASVASAMLVSNWVLACVAISSTTSAALFATSAASLAAMVV